MTHHQHPSLVATWVTAYAQVGRFPESVSAAEQARDLALAAGQKEIAAKVMGC